MGLFTASKPSYACLATRIQYGEPITPEKLARVEQAEDFLAKLGFTHIRVRSYGTLVRIEVEPSQITLMAQANTRKLLPVLRNWATITLRWTWQDSAAAAWMQGCRNRSRTVRETVMPSVAQASAGVPGNESGFW